MAQLERWVIAYLVERFKKAGKDVPTSLRGSPVSLKGDEPPERPEDQHRRRGGLARTVVE